MGRRSYVLAISCAFVLSAACAAEHTATPTASPSPRASVDPPQASTAPATLVFLVRHAEKASDGTGDPPLTAAGSARAQCLAGLLADAGITHAYSSELQRTASTVAPLANKMGIDVSAIPANDTAAMVSALDGLAPGTVAIVAGHSNTIPAIAKALGVSLQGLDSDGYLPHEEYDRLVAIVRAPSIAATVVQLRYCAPSPTP